jgi:hypothetical protein
VLACYLDDSGKDPQNVITTIAGYVASEEAWDKFEEEVAPAFAERNVSVLHAMDLNGTRGEFEGWSVLNKQAFVARIAQAASRHVTMGLSMSALKGTYKEHSRYRAETERQTVTPYTFCFQVVCDWLLRISASHDAFTQMGSGFIWRRVTRTTVRRRRNFITSGSTSSWRTCFTRSALLKSRTVGRSSWLILSHTTRVGMAFLS